MQKRKRKKQNKCSSEEVFTSLEHFSEQELRAEPKKNSTGFWKTTCAEFCVDQMQPDAKKSKND